MYTHITQLHVQFKLLYCMIIFHYNYLRSCTLLYFVALVISDGEKKAVRSNRNS